ncbi:MAG: SPOR domain-containing protein [Bacteroidota bacterium]|jgi:hypothetical protein
MYSEINIWSLVKSLLHNHNCVVVPSLGGFLAHQQSASIDPISQTIKPPHKHITFNSKLNLNDGLLATLIADHLKIDYIDAIKIIEEEVVLFNQKLVSLSFYKIEELGTFTLNTAGKLVFEPEKNINYLLNSFGLETVKLNSVFEIRTTKIIQKIDTPEILEHNQSFKSEKEEQVNKLVTQKNNLAVLTPQRKTKNGVLITVVGSLLILVLGLNAFIFLQEGNLTPIRKKYNELNIGIDLETVFETNSIDKNKVDKNELLKMYNKNATPKEIAFSNKIIFDFSTTKNLEQEVSTEKDIDLNTIDIDNEKQISKLYYIVAAAYNNEEKAKSFLNEIKNDGFDNAELILNTSKNKKALKYLVTYNKFSDLSITETELNTLNEYENPDAWIFESNQ